MRERFPGLAQPVEIMRSFEMRSCGFIVDRQRGAHVSKCQGELAHVSQDFRARRKRVDVFGIRRETRVQCAEFAQRVVGNKPILLTNKIFADLQFRCVLRAIHLEQRFGGLDARAHRCGLEFQRALGVIECQQGPISQSEKPRAIEQQCDVVG